MKNPGSWFLFHVYNDDEKGFICHSMGTVDDDFLRKLNYCKGNINKYFSSQKIISAVFANRNDLIESIVSVAKSYGDQKTDYGRLMEDGSFHIGRLFANTCTMFRLFIDHFDRNLMKKWGKDSEEYLGWKRVLSSEYDSRLGYVIMCVMRNYIQHYDMPPLILKISEKADEDGFSMRVDIRLSELMNDPFAKNKISKRVAGYKDQISLLEIIDEWSNSFKKIIQYIDAININEMAEIAEEILQIRHKFGIEDGGEIAISWLPKVNKKPEKIEINLDWIPEEKAGFIKNIIKQSYV